MLLKKKRTRSIENHAPKLQKETNCIWFLVLLVAVFLVTCEVEGSLLISFAVAPRGHLQTRRACKTTTKVPQLKALHAHLIQATSFKLRPPL